MRFVAKEVGPIVTEGNVLLLGATHDIAETPSPHIVVVPGGSTTPGQMVDDDVLAWLRKVHEKGGSPRLSRPTSSSLICPALLLRPGWVRTRDQTAPKAMR
jgi:hypothetical protein